MCIAIKKFLYSINVRVSMTVLIAWAGSINDAKRAAFTVQEVVDLTINFTGEIILKAILKLGYF